MRHVCFCLGLITLWGVLWPTTLLAAPGARTDDQCGWAIYAGPAPWGERQAIFLLGEDWAPQVLDQMPADTEPGAQGTLCWQRDGGAPGRLLKFNPEEVPIRAQALLQPEAGGAPLWEKHSWRGVVLLLRVLAPEDPQALAVMRELYRKKALSKEQWLWALMFCGFGKVLQTEARSDPAGPYEQLMLHLYQGRWGEARALLRRKAGPIAAVATALHDGSERYCAPVRRKGPKQVPTHMSWAGLLDIAALSAGGKAGEAAKALRVFARRTPRWRESAYEAPHEGPALPEHELFKLDRPRALLQHIERIAGPLAE